MNPLFFLDILRRRKQKSSTCRWCGAQHPTDAHSDQCPSCGVLSEPTPPADDSTDHPEAPGDAPRRDEETR